MRAKQFLMWGGIILVVLALLGFVNFRIGDTLYFDSAENWAHLVLGVVALLGAFYAPADMQRTLALVFGVVALYFGLHGFLVMNGTAPNYYGKTNLELIDNLLHLAVGVWGLWAGMGKKSDA